MQQSISRPAMISIAAVVLLLLGAGIWWRTQPRANGESYSEAVSKLESSPEFEARQKERSEAKAGGKKVADPTIPDDKVYQPEDR